MVPGSDAIDGAGTPDGPAAVADDGGTPRTHERTDGGTTNAPAFGLEDERLYFVVREAVEDAILGVVGTLALVGIALVLVWTGGAAVVNATASPAGRAIGLLLVLAGFYVAASTLEVIPPIREWF